MILDEFIATNVSNGDKSSFLNAFNDARTTTKMAYFEDEGVCYTATDTKSSYGPLFKLCGAGIRRFKAMANYDVTSAGRRGDDA